MRRRRFLLLMLFVAGVAAIGTAAYLWRNGISDPEREASATAPATIQPVEGTVQVGVESPAVVEPFQSRTLRSRSPGVVEFTAAIGTMVSEGDVVVRLDAADLQARLRRAEIDLAESQIAHDRAVRAVERAEDDLRSTEELHAAGAATREQLDSRRDSLYQAQYAAKSASFALERRQLDYESALADIEARAIRAPFSGVISASAVGRGDTVGTNTELITIVDTSRVRLLAEIDEYDISFVAPDMRAQARVDALEALGDARSTFTGVVDFVSPTARIVSNISVFTVTARFNNADGFLRSGMTADLLILTAQDTGLIVPSRAVSSVRDRSYVDVLLEDGEIEPRRVVTGANDGVGIAVLEGLEPSDKVVVPEIAGLDALSAPPAGPVEPNSTLIPLSVPGTSGTSGGGGAGGGAGRQ